MERHFSFHLKVRRSLFFMPPWWIISSVFFLSFIFNLKSPALKHRCVFCFLFFFTGSDGFSYYCCIFTESVLLLVQYSKTPPPPPPRRHKTFQMWQLLDNTIGHKSGNDSPSGWGASWLEEFVCVTHLVNAFLWYFFSSTSLLNLGGDGSLCTTASSPTDSTGEINNHLFAERLSVSEREREREGDAAKLTNILIC